MYPAHATGAFGVLEREREAREGGVESKTLSRLSTPKAPVAQATINVIVLVLASTRIITRVCGIK